jgi:hypothetical protein
MAESTELVRLALAAGEGILRLAPCWVPRAFLVPGGRLKLAQQDLYAFGAHRGGIDERWIASTTHAENGPATLPDEGLSYIVVENGSQVKKVLLKEAIDRLGDMLLGSDVMVREGGWNVLGKLFDNQGPIPHHMHQREEHARRVGRQPKPEAYYFPPQYNLKENNFPYTFMGLEPGATKEDVRRCLERWDQGDNGILHHSKAYKLKPGAGWDIPAGILHAPGSLVTYEPQRNSDVLAMFQSMVDGRPVPWELVVKDVPEEYQHDLDYIVDMLDWEANVDPEFMKHHFVDPVPVKAFEETGDCGYQEKWISYASPHFSAKELAIRPGRSVTVPDSAAYGLLVVQGFGRVGRLAVETPTLIHFGQLTRDELFVTAAAAQAGVTIVNASESEDLVMLKHFGPGNPDVELLRAGKNSQLSTAR